MNGPIHKTSKKVIENALTALLNTWQLTESGIVVEHPAEDSHGDWATNIALVKLQEALEKQIIAEKNPRTFADLIVVRLKTDSELQEIVESITVAGPGFINFNLKTSYLLIELHRAQTDELVHQFAKPLKDVKIMVEYAHPNTHKEMHIGHMRTLITGEAVSRILEAAGATVFRANYQGDIGPHVAKAIWGTEKILTETGKSWDELENVSHSEKAHLLGQGYIQGNQHYEDNKEEIDRLNNLLYQQDLSVVPIYERTRRWSLEYYDELYKRFGTTFDKLYFESDIAEKGMQIVKENIGKIFEESQGAIIFDGEKYGLHKRVFITAAGNPTYEAKEMGLAPTQYEDFAFDRNIHVVANEQAGYFRVVIKALELLDKEKFEGEYHLSMGMVDLVGRKISSRTGVIITVDSLLDEIKAALKPLITNAELNLEEYESVAEKGTIAAVKYSVLKNSPTHNVQFDINQSVSLSGDSGPYLQYTYARCQSVLRKARDINLHLGMPLQDLEAEEISVLKSIYQFEEIVHKAADEYGPHVVSHYLFALAQRFNAFYNQCSILEAESGEAKVLRLMITKAVAHILKHGLYLLGIESPEKM